MDAWERWRIVCFAALSVEDIEDIYLFGTMITGILLIGLGFALGYRRIQKTGTAVQSPTRLPVWLKLWEERSALRLNYNRNMDSTKEKLTALQRKNDYMETKMDKMDRESSLQNWNVFTRPKDKTILSFSGSPRQWPWQGCCCNLPRESNAVRRSCVSPPQQTLQTLPLPRPLAFVRFDPPALSCGSDQRRIRGCGPDVCLLGRIHFPCGYVCLWCMCFCVAEVFFLFSHCTPQGA